MSAARIAEVLGLELVHAPAPTWEGVQGDLAFGLVGQKRGLLTPETGAQLFCVHSIPLRVGMLAQSALAWGATDPLDDVPLIPIGDPRVEHKVRLRAAEKMIAHELVRDIANLLIVAVDDGVLAIDDQRVWVTLERFPDDLEVLAIARRMTEISSRLVAMRVGWEADFETAIGGIWSRLAASAGFRWNADRSAIDGELHGARFEARVDGEPCRLYTELYLEWPSLQRGLSIERTEPRGATAWEPPGRADEEALTLSFHREFRGPGAKELSTAAMHAALEIATTGASVTLDDTGLVLRVDKVDLDEAAMGRLFRGALTITKELLSPSGPTALYR